MRLGKYLSTAGIASRRASEGLVRAGRVRVGGVVVTDPARDVPETSVVTVDGEPVSQPGRRVVYALNKPPGVVSTAHDPGGRPTVVSLVPAAGGSGDQRTRLYPVGRLDIDTTGLILLTNDGQLAHRLTHPRFEVPKTYRAVVRRPPVGDGALTSLREGVSLEDGPAVRAQVRRLAPDELEITIHEGRKRQVRRMCEAVGHAVRTLERVAIGPLALGQLPRGAYRQLSAAEVDQLLSAARSSTSARAGRRISAGW
jgi:23S rRNA pseudouridine2605 synthase